MTQRMFRICILLTLGFAASQTILPAQERNELEGIWSVSINVTNCQTGAPIRTVASLQQFRPDGSMIETANTASRGIRKESEVLRTKTTSPHCTGFTAITRTEPLLPGPTSRTKSSLVRTTNSPHLASSSTMTPTANYSRPAASRTPLPA